MIEVTFNGPKQQAANGYGHSTPNLVRYMREQGIELIQDGKPRKIGLGYGYPRMIKDLAQCEVRLAFTMFESDKMPDSWKADLDQATAIIVPSEFCLGAMRRLGYEAYLVPLGIEHDIWPFLERPNRSTFTFLSYESCNVRKGFFELFEAFKQEFGDRDDVRIIFKTARTENVIPLTQYKNMEVRKGPYTREQMLELLFEADAFIFPSRGEGFGHPPLEAVATGLPVICPNAHGIATYFNPLYMEYVEHHPVPARYDHIKNEDVGNYVKCDIQSLRIAMRHVINHFGGNHKTWSQYRRNGHDWVMREWTYPQKTAPLLAEIIKQYA